jgi:C1A family cysteine protease/predicted secreted protein
VLGKTLHSSWLLLNLLLFSAHLAYAAEPPTPTPIPPHPAGDPEPVQISIVLRPDGTWEGEAHLSIVPQSPWSSDLEETLDAQVQQKASAILGSHRIRATWTKTLDEPLSEKGTIQYTFFLEGEDAQEIVGLALDAGQVAEQLQGPVALELSGAVREGQTLALTLPGNPSTGYSWGVEAMDGNTLSQVNGVETHQVAQGLGTPARQTIRLRAAETGQADLRLAHQRPWQADLPPTMVLSVQADGLNLADTCSALSMPLSPPALTPPIGSQAEGEQVEQSGQTLQQDASLSSVQSLPGAYNWCGAHGGCPPVRDQGYCGSCWAFGTVGPLEAWVKYRSGGESVDLSEQYLLSCNTDGWDCSGGWWAHDYHEDKWPPSESQAGAVLESASPYQASETACAGPYSHPYNIASWRYVGNDSSVPSVAAIQQAIYTYGPVAAAMCTDSAFASYSGGVFQTDESSQCGINMVDHAIVLVGWDDSQQAWILRNSWGSGWGEGGYMRIRYGTSNVGFAANYVVYTYIPFTPSDWVYLPLITRDIGTGYTLSNGDFENGRDGSWSESSSNGWTLILDTSDLPVSPHGGSWATWLGGDYDETGIVSQQVTIPSNATTLNYWYWSASQDLCGYDYAYVRFGSSTLKTHNLCEDSATGSWVAQQLDVTGWRDQTVELRFVVQTDGSLNSNFFLDDVSVSTPTASRDLTIFADSSAASPGDASAPRQSR